MEVAYIIGEVRQNDSDEWAALTYHTGIVACSAHNTRDAAVFEQVRRVDEQDSMWREALQRTAPARHPVRTEWYPGGHVDIRQYYHRGTLYPGRAVVLAVRNDRCRASFMYSGRTPKAAAQEALARAESFLNQ